LATDVVETLEDVASSAYLVTRACFREEGIKYE
jgi:hypothetical protein